LISSSKGIWDPFFFAQEIISGFEEKGKGGRGRGEGEGAPAPVKCYRNRPALQGRQTDRQTKGQTGRQAEQKD
jgi:hypothetical protein